MHRTALLSLQTRYIKCTLQTYKRFTVIVVMTSKYRPANSKTGLSDNGMSSRPIFSGSARAVGTDTSSDMEKNYADSRPRAAHAIGNPVMSRSPPSTACGGQIKGISCISELAKTKNESLMAVMPHEKTEEVSVQIDLTDPEDLIKKLQILDLTDEEEEELLQQAYDLNQKLKLAWFRHQQGTEHIRSFIVSAPAMGEPANLSGIKLPPLQTDIKAYGSMHSHSKSAGINKHWPATTGVSLQSQTDKSTSYAKLDLPAELKEGRHGNEEKQQVESKWSGSTWKRQ